MDFVDRVADDTVNGIHTKHLELPYPWVLTEDINEHVMRSDEAYGLGDDFIEDETIVYVLSLCRSGVYNNILF